MCRQLSRSIVAFMAAAFVAGGAIGTTKSPSTSVAPTDAVPKGPLPRNVVPTLAAVSLRIDPAQARFMGAVRLDVKVARPTRTIWLHGRELNVTRATITPKGGPPQRLQVTSADVSGVLRLRADKPIGVGHARIELTYDAPFGQLQGAYRVKAAGENYVLTQMEAQGARNTFPGFDEPGFKQPWNISLTIPDGSQGVANTRLLKTLPAQVGWKTLVFATTEPLPSYLIAFAVGPWDIVDATPLAANAVRSRPLPLRGIAPRGQGARMRYMLERTGETLAAEEAYFGIAYPYDKLDLLAAPDFGPGAMENAGLIVYRDQLMYADEKSPVKLRRTAHGTHAHELSHKWFGDLVTMPWWDDLWLNEAFASWMAVKIVDELQHGRHGDRYLLESSLRAMGQDSLASTRRIREPITVSTDIASAFDGITYDKGGAVLAMFEHYIGADRFREGIRSYLRRHAKGNATSADLVAALATASESPAAVREAFASFLDQPGVPMLQVAVDCSGVAPTLKLEQQRFTPVGSSVSTAGEWQIPLCVRWGEERGDRSQCTLVSGRSATVPLKAASCPSWVMPSAGGYGYYRFALAPADAARLEENFERLDEREQRVYADSVSSAFSAGQLDVQAYLRAAAKLARAPARETATALVDQLEWMLLHLPLTAAQQQALREMVRQSYGPRLSALATQSQPGETDDDRLMRSELLEVMAYVGRDPELRASLAAKGRRMLGLQMADETTPGDGKLHLDAVEPDQLGLTLRVAMEDGDARVFDALLAHVTASQDGTLRTQLLRAVAGAHQPELQERSRRLLLGPDAVRINEIALVLGERRGRGTELAEDPVVRQAARDWIDTHFEALAARITPYGGRLAKIYANGLCRTADADALQTRFAERLRQLDGGPRTLAQAVEGVRLCAALQARHQGSSWQLP